MPARLTVVIPMFNSASTVEQTIESLREQTYGDWEAVVVNDGSTDHGPAIVEELMRSEPRLRMVTQNNRGLAGARNRGIDECRTQLIHFLDADDWMTPRGYEWLVGAIDATGGSYGGYEHRDDHGRRLDRQSPISAPLVGIDELLEWNRAATHAHLFSRDFIGDERFDERLTCVEDYDMWLRLAARGGKWTAVEQIVAGYRLRPNSMSKQFDAMCRTYQAVVERAFADADQLGWAERGIDLSDRRFNRVVGNMALTYATMDALIDPSPSKARAARLFDQAARPDIVTPALAANTASVALLFGACTAPDIDGWSERRWLASLRQWWVRCADDGWLRLEQIEAAFAELARKVVHPDPIVESMLGAAASGGGPTCVAVIGLERNGRRVVRRAASRGWKVLAFDDFSDPREAALISDQERSAWGTKVRFARTAEDFAGLLRQEASSGQDVTWLIGPMEGQAAAAAERVVEAAGPKLVQRWSSHRNRIGADNLLKIESALGTRRAMAG